MISHGVQGFSLVESSRQLVTDDYQLVAGERLALLTEIGKFHRVTYIHGHDKE